MAKVLGIDVGGSASKGPGRYKKGILSPNKTLSTEEKDKPAKVLENIYLCRRSALGWDDRERFSGGRQAW
jgi:hypothetical protein